MQDELSLDGKTDVEKIFLKIQRSLDYESGYHAQAMSAYNLYSNVFNMIRGVTKGEDFDMRLMSIMRHVRRSNVYYANVETLKGLVLPQIPSLILQLNAAKKVNNDKYDKEFYNTVINILQSIAKIAVETMKPNCFESFKLDYLITGRGIMWCSVLEDKENKIKTPRLEHVRWQDYCQDTKPVWNAVGWCARRLLYTPSQFCKLFGVDKNDVTAVLSMEAIYTDVMVYQTFGDTSQYVEVWEYWDKPTQSRWFVSKQYKNDADDDSRWVIKVDEYDNVSDENFLPTAEPPMLMYNGMNLIPFSDVWNYVNELQELSYITEKRSKLVASMHLRGYTDIAKSDAINDLSKANPTDDYDDDQIVGLPGFTPNEKEPLIYYVDNKPRVELLKFLQDEYQFLQQRIYNLTGINEQMRNVTVTEDDETATSIRLKSKFGSRRLKEHQQRLLNYWIATLKLLLHKICQSYEMADLKKLFSYDFPDNNARDVQDAMFEKEDKFRALEEAQSAPQEQGYGNEQEPAQQMPQMQQEQQQQYGPEQQPAMPQQPQMQQGQEGQQPMGQGQEPMGQQQQQQPQQPSIDPIEQASEEFEDASQRYEELQNQVTWKHIIDFFRADKLVSFMVSAHLDDIENKVIQDEKKNSDLEYMNAIMNIVNQVIGNVSNNPKFADIYTSIFSLSLDNFDQTKAQRDSIDEFIKLIKDYAENIIQNPPQKGPSADDQKKMAEAEESKAKAQLLMAQIQEVQAKIQAMGQPEPDQSGEKMALAQSKLQELQLKHQQDMELEQQKIAARQQEYKEKMASDENLLQMKIQADKERYSEKANADFLKENVIPPEAAQPIGE